ncbi:Unknown protein, partial [Striga hermonthica]
RHQHYLSVQQFRWGLRLSTTLFIITLPCPRYVFSVSARNGRRSILGSSGPSVPTRVCTWCPVRRQMFSSDVTYVTTWLRSRDQLS